MLSRRLAARPEDADAAACHGAAAQADERQHDHQHAVAVHRTQVGGLQAFIDDAGCDKGQKDLHHNLQRGEPDAGPGSALILFELMQYGLHFLHSL